MPKKVLSHHGFQAFSFILVAGMFLLAMLYSVDPFQRPAPASQATPVDPSSITGTEPPTLLQEEIVGQAFGSLRPDIVDDGAIITGTELDLAWRAQAAYEQWLLLVQQEDEKYYQDIVVTGEQRYPETYTHTITIQQGPVYHVWVRGCTNDGRCTGPWSAMATFVTRGKAGPEFTNAQRVFNVGHVPLSWNDKEALRYELWVNKITDTQTEVARVKTTATSYAPVLLTPGDYIAFVRAEFPTGFSTWNRFSFVVE